MGTDHVMPPVSASSHTNQLHLAVKWVKFVFLLVCRGSLMVLMVSNSIVMDKKRPFKISYMETFRNLVDTVTGGAQ